MNQKMSVFIDVSLKILKISIPIIFIIVVAYMFYIKITNVRVENTQNDIIMVVENIKNYVKDGGKLNDFNADFIAYSGYLPSDVQTKQTERGYSILNRFGGKLMFHEAFLDTAERDKYMEMAKDPRLLKNQYRGLHAYTILFTELRRRECRGLAQVNWKARLPNFMGMEISYISLHNPYNGINKLSRGLLTDNIGKDLFNALYMVVF